MRFQLSAFSSSTLFLHDLLQIIKPRNSEPATNILDWCCTLGTLTFASNLTKHGTDHIRVWCADKSWSLNLFGASVTWQGYFGRNLADRILFVNLDIFCSLHLFLMLLSVDEVCSGTYMGVSWMQWCCIVNSEILLSSCCWLI